MDIENPNDQIVPEGEKQKDNVSTQDCLEKSCKGDELSNSEMIDHSASKLSNVNANEEISSLMDQSKFKEDLISFWNGAFVNMLKKIDKPSYKQEEENLLEETGAEKVGEDQKQGKKDEVGSPVPKLDQQNNFMEEIARNIEDLFLIFIYFFRKGGYYQVFAKLRPEKTKQRMLQNGIKNPELVSDIFTTYRKYLFHYERFLAQEESDKWSKINEVLEINPNYLGVPKIFKEPPAEEQKTAFIEEVLSHQTVVLSGFEKVYGIDDKLFDVDMIRKNHGKQVIDIMYQNPRSFGFDIRNKKLRQHKESTTLEKYVEYQHLKNQEKGNVMFAVNIDTDTWKEELAELKKLPPEFTFMSNKDVLSLVKRDILGVNVPQIYLKVEGVWTGGHEENLRMRAININHGPKGSYWYTMSQDEVPRFRALVKQSHSVDIHKSEGLWFADLDFVLRNKLHVEYFIQHKGDIVSKMLCKAILMVLQKVLLGPGCLHWVRAKGLAVNSAWNFATACRNQFEAAFRRFEINKEVDFYQKTIIPLHNLVWELLRKKVPSFGDMTRELLINKLMQYFSRENEAFLKIPDHSTREILKSDENDDVTRCSFCDEEILNYFLYLPKDSHEDYMYFSCMTCLQEGRIPSDSLSTNDVLYYKQEPQILADEMKCYSNELQDQKIRDKIYLEAFTNQCKETSSLILQSIEKYTSDVNTLQMKLKKSKEKLATSSEKNTDNEDEHSQSRKSGSKLLKGETRRSRLVSTSRSSTMMFRDSKKECLSLHESASRGSKRFKDYPPESIDGNYCDLLISPIEGLEVKIKKKVKCSDSVEKTMDCNSDNKVELSVCDTLFPENPLPQSLREILESKPTFTNHDQPKITTSTRRLKQPGFSFLKPLDNKPLI